MAKYLLDTNVVLRFSNPSDSQHDLATEAVATLLFQGNECYLTAQVLIEFWVVATRPVDVNGLGWTVPNSLIPSLQIAQQYDTEAHNPFMILEWLPGKDLGNCY